MTEYFDCYQVRIRTLHDLKDRVAQVTALGASSGLVFYWRGQSNADWGVHSSLHRALVAQSGMTMNEIDQILDLQVQLEEIRLVKEARDWIRPSVGARLTTVDLMARLQHHGVPTRLVDFTSDPYVALFFAVADHDSTDGRLIIAAARGFPTVGFRNDFSVPWRHGAPRVPKEWSRQLYSLDDQRDFLRIIRQQGAFLTGGTPSTQPQRRAFGENLTAVDVRRNMSLPLTLHSWAQAEAAMNNTRARGRSPSVASALTLRIPAESKQQLLNELDSVGINWEYLFPDPEGLRQRGAVARRLTEALESVSPKRTT